MVVAHTGEQRFWGFELQRIGVAPAVVPKRRLTADALARRVRQVLDSSEMRLRAKAAADIMRNENGVNTAVELINSKFRPPASGEITA